MSVNWTPIQKLRARGFRLGPLVAGGDTATILELARLIHDAGDFGLADVA